MPLPIPPYWNWQYTSISSVKNLQNIKKQIKQNSTPYFSKSSKMTVSGTISLKLETASNSDLDSARTKTLVNTTPKTKKPTSPKLQKQDQENQYRIERRRHSSPRPRSDEPDSLAAAARQRTAANPSPAQTHRKQREIRH